MLSEPYVYILIYLVISMIINILASPFRKEKWSITYEFFALLLNPIIFVVEVTKHIIRFIKTI